MEDFKFRLSPPAASLLLLIAAVPAVPAQPSNPTPVPPRITALKGAVVLNHAGGRAQTPAATGLTLSAGDRLVTAGRAGVEVQFDNRVLQLAAHTELRLVRVEPGSYAMALDKGTVTCQIVEAPAATFHLATPSVSLRPQAPGVYRIAVTAAGESQITAQRGHIQVFAPQGSQWILAGQKMLARGPADNPEFKIVSAFSSWPPVPVIVFASMSIAVAAVASAAGGSHSRHGR